VVLENMGTQVSNIFRSI